MPIGRGITDYAGKAMQAQQATASTLSQMQKEEQEPKKTAGGAMQSAAGGALAGSAVMPGWGTAIGAVAGVAMYYLS